MPQLIVDAGAAMGCGASSPAAIAPPAYKPAQSIGPPSPTEQKPQRAPAAQPAPASSAGFARTALPSPSAAELRLNVRTHRAKPSLAPALAAAATITFEPVVTMPTSGGRRRAIVKPPSLDIAETDRVGSDVFTESDPDSSPDDGKKSGSPPRSASLVRFVNLSGSKELDDDSRTARTPVTAELVALAYDRTPTSKGPRKNIFLFSDDSSSEEENEEGEEDVEEDLTPLVQLSLPNKGLARIVSQDIRDDEAESSLSSPKTPTGSMKHSNRIMGGANDSDDE